MFFIKFTDRPRTIVLVPCDHQVLCSVCAPSVVICPLCRQDIRNKKIVPSNLSTLNTTNEQWKLNFQILSNEKSPEENPVQREIQCR